MGIPTPRIYTLASWDAYPRVRYFYRYFASLLPRFRRVAGSMPQCFHDSALDEELNNLFETFSHCIQLNVYGGTDLDSSDLVISSTGQETGSTDITPKLTLYVVSLKVEATDHVKDVLAKTDEIMKSIPDAKYLIVSCVVIDTTMESSVGTAISSLLEQSITLRSTHVVVNSALAESISEFLENLIIQGFVRINNHLDQFVHRQSLSTHECDILETAMDIFKREECNLLLTSGADISTHAKLQSDTDKSIVQQLARMIKCHLIPALSQKFNMSAQHCNSLLHDKMFEETLVKSFLSEKSMTDKTFEDILADISKQSVHGDLKERFEKVLPEHLDTVESYFEQTYRTISVMRRMKYEIEGYLKETIVKLACTSRPVAHALPKDLREALRSVSEIYGVGTFYGEIQIHIEHFESSEENTSSREESKQKTRDREKLTEEKIKEIIRSHRFSYPYSIKYVQKNPVPMLYEELTPGGKLVNKSQGDTYGTNAGSKSQGDIYGTNAGYILDIEGNVYGLTCAHVTGTSGSSRLFLGVGSKLYPFSHEQFVYYGHSDVLSDLRQVDISAAKLIPTLQGCRKNGQFDCSIHVKLVHVTQSVTDTLVGTRVYKVGASTGLTYGIIASADYALFKGHDKESLLIFDALPDVNDGKNGGGDQPLHTGAREFESEETLQVRPSSGSENTNMVPKEPACWSLPDDTQTHDGATGCSDEDAEKMVVDANKKGVFKLFVPDPDHLVALRREADVESFGKKGDSGSIIGLKRLVGHSMVITAIAMFSAGDLTIRSDRNEYETGENKCLGFRLQIGLEKIQENHRNIFWRTYN